MTISISHLIEFLYRLPNEPLTFSKKIRQTNLFRKAFLMAVLFVSLVYCDGMSFLTFLYKITAVCFLVVITVTDFEHYTIFDIVLLPFAFFGILFALILDQSLLERLLSAFIGGSVFFILRILTKKGLGGGDVKLVATLGLWLGAELIPTLLNGAILGGISALFLLLSGLKSRTDFFAYGPYLCLATAWQIFKP